MRRGSRLAGALPALLVLGILARGAGAADCPRPVYLTFDTGHMGVAPLVAEVLEREQVRASFFLANEKTLDGGSSLDQQWAPWWRDMAARGHVFGSHTYDHVYWQRDLPGERFRVKPSFGPRAGQTFGMKADEYCRELDRSAARFKEMTGRDMLPLFRAPGGRTSPALLKVAEQRCGYRHVGWASAGFLGDELPSDKYPNRRLLERALRDIRPGDILMAHLGIWSRQDPWAPAVLAPLIAGLKQRGFCFATLAEHPGYQAWLDRQHHHGNR
ncbi:MAG: polysaccharide deacetylase family protein [Pigmentiphaga sp.]|uniref:polysaccharide deacetylase family protein n=1 Tax=Pigmentiphaga sp. TaxID=1977564 RepID=UPI0029B01159|nr:polysaccharide deacetylase family protein [Pigmentiphaga sp.]MDX3905363.1 polysaccharide deacetylase family protein [Pigmentiphaga sp.]